MQFRILGPVEVWLGSRLAVPSAQSRALLAALLLGANRVQETSWLVEAVWGDRPPAASADHLAAHIAKLRRLLGRRITLVGPQHIGSASANGAAGSGAAPSGTTASTRHSAQPAVGSRADAEADAGSAISPNGKGSTGGYLLRVEPMQLDLALFEETAKRARIDLAARDYASAAAGFRAGLALWRGAPLSDVDSKLLREFEAPRLEELRLSAVEDRIEADLRLGQHAQVVDELRSLTAAHPLRERFCRHLIIALYRCRHRDAALQAYATAERAMRALGVSPGPSLRQLALAVRTDHPSLGPPDPRR